MSGIVEHERDTYAAMWAVDRYHEASPGQSLLPIFLDMAKPRPGASVLDAGCGAGKGSLALREAGFNVLMCDLVDVRTPDAQALPFFATSLWSPLRDQVSPNDYVYCCDVLEHIPTPFTMLVVSRLLEVAERGVFLSISLMPDNFGIWIGKTLHQTVQSFAQWREQLDTIGHVVECRDLMHTGCFLVEPRKGGQ